MGTLQTDIGRHSTVVIATAVVIGAALIYLVYGYASSSATTPSSIGAVHTVRGIPSTESEHYAEVLQKYNVRNAETATRSGETYLSVFSARPQAVPPPAEPAPAPAPAPQDAAQTDAATAAPSAPPQAQPQGPADQKYTGALQEQAEGLMNNWAAVTHSAARSSEVNASVSSSSAATRASTTNFDEGTPATRAEIARAGVVVPGLSLLPAILATDIDTDESSMVEATIPAGQFAGARVYAMGYQRMNESVDMTFTLMSWRDKTYRINAKAVDQNTIRSALSGEISNRYFSRILIPALALGLGKTGQLFEQADSQTIVTPLGGVIQSRNGTPSSRTVAGAVLGGTATETGQVLRRDAGQLPVKQVVVARNITIGVRFVSPVFASDEITSKANDDGTLRRSSPYQSETLSSISPVGHGIVSPTSQSSSQ